MINININVYDSQESISELIDRLVAIAVKEKQNTIKQEQHKPVPYIPVQSEALDYLKSRYKFHVARLKEQNRLKLLGCSLYD